jgi:hypothetical protein
MTWCFVMGCALHARKVRILAEVGAGAVASGAPVVAQDAFPLLVVVLTDVLAAVL